MSWFKAESSLRTHPKIEKLARRLSICLPHARGLVTGLWAWVCDTAPDGNLTAYDAEDLAIAADWEGDPELFLRTLIEVRLLDCVDGKISVHEWMERAESYKRAVAAASRRDRVGNSSRRVPQRGEDGEERRSEDSYESSCSEPVEPAPEPVLDFPTSGKVESWALDQEQVDKWSSTYPAVDVLFECKKALAWIEANPSNKKTARGMPAFLNRWLSKTQDRGGSSPSLERFPPLTGGGSGLRARARAMREARERGVGPVIETTAELIKQLGSGGDS